MQRNVSRQTYQDSIRRNLTGPSLFGLLARAGIKQVGHADSAAVERKVVDLNSNLEIRDTIGAGYGVERVEKMPDGTARAHLAKTIGINYPEQ